MEFYEKKPCLYCINHKQLTLIRKIILARETTTVTPNNERLYSMWIDRFDLILRFIHLLRVI